MMQEHDHGVMMGGGMMGHEMMGHGRGHGMAARIIFSLMDADGDGKLTLQEWQAAHERIFKAIDTNHDGTVTLEEMEAFMHGH
jgi:Ca2+-binding EF-hand superfamily protein